MTYANNDCRVTHTSVVISSSNCRLEFIVLIFQIVHFKYIVLIMQIQLVSFMNNLAFKVNSNKLGSMVDAELPKQNIVEIVRLGSKE